MAIALTTATATILTERALAIISAACPRIFNNTNEFVTNKRTNLKCVNYIVP